MPDVTPANELNELHDPKDNITMKDEWCRVLE